MKQNKTIYENFDAILPILQNGSLDSFDYFFFGFLFGAQDPNNFKVILTTIRNFSELRMNRVIADKDLKDLCHLIISHDWSNVNYLNPIKIGSNTNDSTFG